MVKPFNKLVTHSPLLQLLTKIIIFLNYNFIKDIF